MNLAGRPPSYRLSGHSEVNESTRTRWEKRSEIPRRYCFPRAPQSISSAVRLVESTDIINC